MQSIEVQKISKQFNFITSTYKHFSFLLTILKIQKWRNNIIKTYQFFHFNNIIKIKYSTCKLKRKLHSKSWKKPPELSTSPSSNYLKAVNKLLLQLTFASELLIKLKTTLKLTTQPKLKSSEISAMVSKNIAHILKLKTWNSTGMVKNLFCHKLVWD